MTTYLLMNLCSLYIYAIADDGPINPILEGIANDIMVRIQDHYVPADFMVLDMAKEEEDVPIILGRPFLNTTNVIIYVGSGEVQFQFLGQKVCCYFNSYTTN
jgi:hypothetical protein